MKSGFSEHWVKNSSNYYTLVACICFTFWITVTGVILVPILKDKSLHIIAFLYSLATVMCSAIILYHGIYPLATQERYEK